MTPNSADFQWVINYRDSPDVGYSQIALVLASGVIEVNRDRTIRGTISDLQFEGQPPFDLANAVINPVLTVNGTTVDFGEYLPAYAAYDVPSSVPVATDYLDVTAALADEIIATPVTVPAGSDLLAAAASIVNSASSRWAYWVGVSSGGTAAVTRVFDAQTTRLEAANTLCRAAGFDSVQAAPGGGIWTTPVVAAIDRDATLLDDADLLAPGVIQSRDWVDTANRVTVVGRGDQDTVANLAQASMTSGPFGFAARGRWIDLVVEAESNDVPTLAQIARDRLMAGSSPVARVSVNLWPRALRIGERLISGYHDFTVRKFVVPMMGAPVIEVEGHAVAMSPGYAPDTPQAFTLDVSALDGADALG